jgi:hypothetical protein
MAHDTSLDHAPDQTMFPTDPPYPGITQSRSRAMAVGETRRIRMSRQPLCFESIAVAAFHSLERIVASADAHLSPREGNSLSRRILSTRCDQSA